MAGEAELRSSNDYNIDLAPKVRPAAFSTVRQLHLLMASFAQSQCPEMMESLCLQNSPVQQMWQSSALQSR
jgi:hypothetical protein